MPGLTRDAIFVDWVSPEQNRLFRLVDTAGLTRVVQDRRLLLPAADRRLAALHRQDARVNKAAAQLPGTRGVVARGGSGGSIGGRGLTAVAASRSDDPSQFSLQVSEMALASALSALRYSQVVVMVVDGEQGRFTAVELKIARK